ncbi:hypothetical protein CO151_10160 [bacterium CG_4_9_14_3_um_filter_65_15]|nr:MAG: hypothetical protein CO151_10160 [bacterium CG_4_9_14_3_um_filter_65_15]
MIPVKRRLAILFLLLALADVGLLPAAAADSIPSALRESPVFKRFDLGEDPPSEQTLAGLVALGIQNNRGLRSAAAEVAAATEEIAQVKALPDPTVGLTTYLEPVETRVGPQQLGLQASQSFPWFGTLGAKGDMAAETALASREKLDAMILEVMTSIRTKALEIAYLDSSIAVTRSHLDLLRQWERSAQDAYAAGRGSYRALIRAQMEIGQVGNRLESFRGRRGPLVATLNAELDREPGAPLAEIRLPAAPSRDADTTRMTALLEETNPRLLRWNHLAASAVLQGKIAGKMGLPGFTVGVTMIRTGEARMSGVDDSGKDALMATFGMRVPLWRGKTNAAKDQARQNMLRAADARAQALNDLRAELAMTLYRLDDARRQVDLYASALIPKAEQSLAASLDAFAADQADYLDVIDAEKMLLEFRLALARARTDELIQAARLEALIATPLGMAS